MHATHICTTSIGNRYKVAILGRYGDVTSVQVIEAYQEYGNKPGAMFGVYDDELEAI